MATALADLRIVEWGELVSAAFCTKLLADLGAQVVKVEPPGGDPARAYGPFPNDEPHPERSGLFLNLNTNKSGEVLDPNTGADHERIRELLRGADVLVTNYPRLTVERAGLSYEQLRSDFPRLVYCHLTPFGLEGPYRD
ncbi:MAG: CoA transferase, partial [Chloroflexi bacterium]|nr:CoA transferase [Chloroflexota bacterium]